MRLSDPIQEPRTTEGKKEPQKEKRRRGGEDTPPSATPYSPPDTRKTGTTDPERPEPAGIRPDRCTRTNTRPEVVTGKMEGRVYLDPSERGGDRGGILSRF